ncbi:uncharacterized protein LOC133730601 [Rosa rugosa]|uniref:uncharacterized protein LOC133730601 n=1 Tax=Rosa rugosa TaxID=74645 RepID=UPI002B40B268|nr:uncharacterized protein LOC133730601 [Rosa rugosa]
MRRVFKWKAPPKCWLKINFNGAFNGGTGKAAVGVVVRDETGVCLGAVGKAFSYIHSAEHAELTACREAVDNVITHLLHPVIFETDCLILKQQLCQERGQNLSALGRLYDDVSADLENLPNSWFVYARRPREANKAAHLLAGDASANDQSFFWPTVPFFKQDVIVWKLYFCIPLFII